MPSGGATQYLDRASSGKDGTLRRAVRPLDPRRKRGAEAAALVDSSECASPGALIRSHAWGLAAVLLAAPARAQDMEPKAYSAAPVGMTFVVASATSSNGSVVLDPTLPITDIDADVDALVLAVGRSFDFFGDLAVVTMALPYVVADVTGQVLEQGAATSRSGLGDARFKLAVNLRGNPAMTAREFAGRRGRRFSVPA